MTTKEMIETLRYKAENIKAHIEPEFFNDVADELERQIAKKPKDITPHYMDSKVYECPICKEVYTYRDAMNNYCKYCGQKFLWEVK